MHVDNVWRKGRNYKGKGKGKGNYKGSKRKGKYRSKGHDKGFDKGNKETTTKEDRARAKEKATQDPKDMDQAKATKAKETTANQKEKETTTTQHVIDVASLASGHKTAECQYGT